MPASGGWQVRPRDLSPFRGTKILLLINLVRVTGLDPGSVVVIPL
jgi:hypothetical protein